jgi:hypothetical protein
MTLATLWRLITRDASILVIDEHRDDQISSDNEVNRWPHIETQPNLLRLMAG